MIFAMLVVVCWTIGGFASSRCAREWGSAKANTRRLAVASCLLAVWALPRLGDGLPFGWQWFLASGVLHLGIGDLFLYATYRQLGPRLGILVCGGLAAPSALLAEWLILGTFPPALSLLFAFGILGFVAIAMAPKERSQLGMAAIWGGAATGLAAALGQGLAAVATRIGYMEQAIHDSLLDPTTTTFFRVIAGLGTLIAIRVITAPFAKKEVPAAYANSLGQKGMSPGTTWRWLLIASIFGPIIGVSFLHAALETTHAGLVQATIATLPVAMIPMAWVFDGDRPSPRAVLGALAALGCLIGLGLTAG